MQQSRPEGVAPTPDEQGRIFLAAGGLELSASDRIVQQNTGSMTLPNGIYLINRASAPRDDVLIVSPARIVDLFGAFRDRNGVLRTGLGAAVSTYFRFDGEGGAVRFNGCNVIDGCGTTAVTQQFRQIIASVASATTRGEDGYGVSGGVAMPIPPVITAGSPELDAIAADPIPLGGGNEEEWRKKKRK